MIAVSVLCLIAVAAAWVHYAHQRRSLAERAVDALYAVAALAYAAAQAADAALVRYRSARSEILAQHLPMYAEVPR